MATLEKSSGILESTKFPNDLAKPDTDTDTDTNKRQPKKRVARRPKSLPPTPTRRTTTTLTVDTSSQKELHLATRNKSVADLQANITQFFSRTREPEPKATSAPRKPLEEKVNNQPQCEPKKLPAPSKDKENGSAVDKKCAVPPLPLRSLTPSKEPLISKGTQQQQKHQKKPHDKQSKLTEFYPVRRSERKPKKESEALLKKRIEERLLLDNDDALGLEIREVPEKGRGVFATRHFSRGDFVVEYSGDLIDVKHAIQREGEYAMDLTKGCYMYYFKANSKDYCIDATKESGRLGRLINHSRLKPNLRTKVMALDNKPRLILVANRDIGSGEELLYDYGDRSKASLDAHPWLAW